MAKRLCTAELHRVKKGSKKGKFYTRIIGGNGYDIIYLGEPIDDRTSALKAPKALAPALKPYFKDYTEDALGIDFVKLDLATGKPYVKPKPSKLFTVDNPLNVAR